MKSEIKIGMEVHRLDCMIGRTMAYCAKMAGFDEVTMMHGRIIRYLHEHEEEAIFQKDIERFFSIGRSTVTSMLKLMEGKGYIERRSVEQDARLKEVCLTEAGKEIHYAMESMIRNVDSELLRGIGKEELEVFFQVIHKIENNARKERKDGSNDLTTCKRV